ncbi:hypothetical protein IB691_08115, partial [Fangia hongkongensis]|nr:hypothetical protein [Fangia hongkongensis]
MGKARIIITFVRLCIALLLIISMCEVSFASTASQVVSSMFPLTPNQIDEVKSEIKSRQQAAATPPSMNNTTGVSRILVANTQPGFSFAPPNIRLGIGVVTT